MKQTNVNSAGKGDCLRPVDRKKYEDNFNLIQWKSKRSVYEQNGSIKI